MEKDEENPFHYYNELENFVNDLKFCLCYSVSGIFREWIEGIDLSNAQSQYYLKNDDLFLTFNYTSLLEDVYEIRKENICHIHINNNDDYVVGHDEYREFDIYDEIISFYLEEIHERLRKDTQCLYNEKLAIFEKIYNSKIESIVFFWIFI